MRTRLYDSSAEVNPVQKILLVVTGSEAEVCIDEISEMDDKGGNDDGPHGGGGGGGGGGFGGGAQTNLGPIVMPGTYTVALVADGKVAALATVGGPQNQAFLATINVTLDVEHYGEELGRVLNWFKKNLNLIAPNESYVDLARLLDQDPEFRSFAGEFLKSKSTGVDHLVVLKKELSEAEIRGILANGMGSVTLPDLAEGGLSVRLEEGNELHGGSTGANQFRQIKIQAAHEHDPGSVIRLDLNE